MGVDGALRRDSETEEQKLGRYVMNEELMRIYAEYGVYAGDEMRKLVADCGGDPSLIPAPRRTCDL